MSIRDVQQEKILINADDFRRVLSRIAHQIIESQKGIKNLILAGIPTRGAILAQRLAENIKLFEGEEVLVATLDITAFRDDLDRGRDLTSHITKSVIDVEGMNVVLVDDVLFTGRSARAALDALTYSGRPNKVQFAVLIDRGHRELPIRADYVGKNMPTSLSERVQVRVNEIDGRDEVILTRVETR